MENTINKEIIRILQIVLFLQDNVLDSELLDLDFKEREIEIGKKVLRNIGWFLGESVQT